MKNENPAGNESPGTDRDRAQNKINDETAGLNSAGLSEEQYQRLRNDIKQEVITEIKEDIGDELRSANEVEVRSDEDNAGLSDIWIAGNPVGTLLDKALQNSSDAKKTAEQARQARSSEHNPKGNDAQNASGDDLLPIERLIRGEGRDDWYVGKATPSVERAKELYRHFREWSSKTPKGRVIKTAGKRRGTSTLQNLLNAVLDGPDLVWKQVYRVCRKLDEWTKGTIQFIEHGRHGKILVMDGPSSSVASG